MPSSSLRDKTLTVTFSIIESFSMIISPTNSPKTSSSESTSLKNIIYSPKTPSIKSKTDTIFYLHNKISSSNSSKTTSGKLSSVPLESYSSFSMSKSTQDSICYQEKEKNLKTPVQNLLVQNIKINMIEIIWKSNYFSCIIWN